MILTPKKILVFIPWLLLLHTIISVTSAGTERHLRRSERQNPDKSKKQRSKSKTKRSKTSKDTRSKKNGSRKGFDIDLIDMGPPNNTPPRLEDLFRKAAKRWENVITNDVEDIPRQEDGFDWFEGAFGPDSPKVNVFIDDILIGYAIQTIDGPGGLFGRAGPRFRLEERDDDDGTLLGIRYLSGIMRFDIDDISKLSDNDTYILLLHEMGHVLGIGAPLTRITLCAKGCIPNKPRLSDHRYTCPNAQQQYKALFPGQTLLVEDEGGGRSACSHWEEDNFRCETSSELMTAEFGPNKRQPLTTVTIGALQDMGYYEVDYEQADEFVCDDDDVHDTIHQTNGTFIPVVESEELAKVLAGIDRVESILLELP